MLEKKNQFLTHLPRKFHPEANIVFVILIGILYALHHYE